ncbi:MAG: OmpA family protein [Paracoccaceae bacterium]
MYKLLTGLGLVLALAACDREAGHWLDSGSFGDSTLNNSLVHSGERDYAVNLANRFAQEVPTTINFAFDSAALDAQARQTLSKQATWIKQFPEVKFRVYGHTDLVGSSAYNKRLGLRRAKAAVNYLVSHGISRRRLEAVASFGETQPVVATSNRERKNRRTVTEVTGFVKRHPTVLDGKYAQIVYREYVESATSETVLSGIQSSSAQQQ